MTNIPLESPSKMRVSLDEQPSVFCRAGAHEPQTLGDSHSKAPSGLQANPTTFWCVMTMALVSLESPFKIQSMGAQEPFGFGLGDQLHGGMLGNSLHACSSSCAYSHRTSHMSGGHDSATIAKLLQNAGPQGV